MFYKKNLSGYKKFISDKKNRQVIKKIILDYPHILESDSRSVKILSKIAFFSWYISSSPTENKNFDVVFKMSVFISTIDDLMDNNHVKSPDKVILADTLVSIINNETIINKLPKKKRSNNVLELKKIDLLKIIIDVIKIANISKDKKIYNLWRNSFRSFVKAMIREEKKEYETNSIKNYLKNARLSIGVSFVLYSYFIANAVSYKSLKKLRSSLVYLDSIVRLSNDISTHNVDEKKDALTIASLESKFPKLYLEKLIEKNLLSLKSELNSLEMSEKDTWTKKTIIETAKILIVIYKKNFFTQ